MKWQIYRPNFSPYQGPGFLEKEEIMLDRLQPRIFKANNGHFVYTTSLKELNYSYPVITLTNTHVKCDMQNYSDELFAATRLIIHANSGYDNFSFDFVKKSFFPIVIGNELRAYAVSDYILACFFKHYTPLSNEITWSKSRVWERKLASELIVMIVGYGIIGKIIADALRPLVKELRMYDPFSKDTSIHEFSPDGADALILCSSLNPTSHHIVNKHVLDRLKDDYLLINAARGGLINEQELIVSLSAHPDAYAYLDVFEKEPANFDLFDLPNIHKTSHMAGVYGNLNEKTLEFEARVLTDFFENNLSHIDPSLILKNRIHNDFLI